MNLFSTLKLVFMPFCSRPSFKHVLLCFFLLLDFRNPLRTKCCSSVFGSASELSPTSSKIPNFGTTIKNSHVSILNPPDSVKLVGGREWEKLLVSSSDSSCWHVALDRFRQLSIECNSSSEMTKTLLALTLTQCHFVNRPKSSFPTEEDGCSLDKPFDIIQRMTDSSEKGGMDNSHEESERKELQTITKFCLSQMSDSAFEVYIQFFNHLDNICFFLHSAVWQERTEETVDRLAYISHEVVGKLDEVHRQHSLLLDQQQVALQHQQKLLVGSQRIEQTLDSGHSQLQSVFMDMRIEVQKEQKRIVSIFDDTFNLISRILHLQQNIVGRLTDFETVLTYIGLIITTFYLTASDSTRSVRATMYALWTLMLIVEIMIWKLSFYFEFYFEFYSSIDVRTLMRQWRLLCISVGLIQWLAAWWMYRDSTTVIVHALQDGLKELKEQLSIPTNKQLTSGVDLPSQNSRRMSYPFETSAELFVLNEQDEQLLDPDFVPLQDTSSDYSDDVSLVTDDLVNSECEEIHQPTDLSNGSTRLSLRSNRLARPRVFRPPRLGHPEDVKYLKLNPLLLFESEDDFADYVTRNRRISMSSIDDHSELSSLSGDEYSIRGLWSHQIPSPHNIDSCKEKHQTSTTDNSIKEIGSTFSPDNTIEVPPTRQRLQRLVVCNPLGEELLPERSKVKSEEEFDTLPKRKRKKLPTIDEQFNLPQRRNRNVKTEAEVRPERTGKRSLTPAPPKSIGVTENPRIPARSRGRGKQQSTPAPPKLVDEMGNPTTPVRSRGRGKQQSTPAPPKFVDEMEKRATPVRSRGRGRQQSTPAPKLVDKMEKRATPARSRGRGKQESTPAPPKLVDEMENPITPVRSRGRGKQQSTPAP